MPIYEYRCPAQHQHDRFRPYAESALSSVCPTCGAEAPRIMSATHVPPDGVYSYAPNIGDAGQFERRVQAMKDGVPVIKKEA